MAIDTQNIRQLHRLKPFLAERYGMKAVNGKYCCPFHSDDTPSMSLTKGRDGTDRFKCHGCGVGGDIIEFVSRKEGIDRKDLGRIVEVITGERAVQGRPPAKVPVEPEPEPERRVTFEPIPSRRFEPQWRGGDLIEALTVNGAKMKRQSLLVHHYRDRMGALLCLTAKVQQDRGTSVLPLRLVDRKWTWTGFKKDEVTPIYGMDRLEAKPRLPVLVVEGEKCVDILQPMVEDRYVVVTWMGGCKRVLDADWQQLWGRDVTLWPDYDHDGSGQAAMDALVPVLRAVQANRIAMVDLSTLKPDTHKSGYDVADMMEQYSVSQVLGWIKAKAKPVRPTEEGELYASEWLPEGTSLVATSTGGVKRDDSSNSWALLKYHPDFRGRFTYDVFSRKPMIDREVMTPALLKDFRFAVVQHKERLLPKESDLGSHVEALALLNKVNTLADQLRGLVWDQQPRLAASALNGGPRGLLIEYANCEDTPLNRVLGMRWMVGAAHRVLQDPNSDDGFQHDGILVLEGEQGLRKTSFLRVLGSLFGLPLYTELQGSLGRDKDDMMKLRGKVIVELAEMTAHRKSDQADFKAFIDRKVDEYRPSYGEEVIRQPRMAVFAGTTNRSAYLTDPTGNRRIWPAKVEEEIDTRKLERDLEQIWAEAVWLAQNGEANFLQGGENDWLAAELGTRDQAESWEETLERKDAFSMWPRDGMSYEDIFDLLDMKAAKDRTKGAEQRIADMLTKRGYEYKQGSPTSPGQTRQRRWRVKRRPRS